MRCDVVRGVDFPLAAAQLPRLALAIAVAIVALATACSDAPEASANAGTPALDPAKLVLRTDTRGEEARAGVKFSVGCRAFRSDDQAMEQEIFLPWALTVTVSDGPAAPGAIAGQDVTLVRSGDYRVACRTVDGALVDVVGAVLPVRPGPPKIVQTRLRAGGVEADALAGAAPVSAGTTVDIVCEGADAHGNAIHDGWSASSAPELPLPPLVAPGIGAWPATQAGAFDIACRVEGTADASPARLVIKSAVPKHLYTLLDPATVVAGNAAKVACVAHDAFGNAVADFPFVLDHAPKLKLKGLYLSATEAGLHSVRCVPESLAWDLFVLHGANLQVQPGPPASLLVARLPDKGVYKRKETVKFLTTVRDAYGNVRADEPVQREVLAPAKGWKDKGEAGVTFSEDATYELKFWVMAAPEVEKMLKILVDGAPPLLTIDEPGWGSTLDGKPSVTVRGKAGDEGAGIADLDVNGKKAFADAVGDWKVQHPAAHGLNAITAVAKDLGGEEAKAVRGFYYASKWYPADAAKPKAAMVEKAVQVFLGKQFFDDGVHNPSQPDDLATIIEVLAGGMLKSSLLPSNLSQGDIEVSLSNTKFGPLKVSLQPVAGGLAMKFVLDGISTDLAVKAKLKLGPIKTSVKVSGDIQIAKVTLATTLQVAIVDGKASTSASGTQVQIDGMKLHVDGIGGLFDFLWNILLSSYKGELEKQIVGLLEGELPKMLQSAFDALAINQSFEVPPLVEGGKTVTVSLVSEVKAMTFTPEGATLAMDASFVSAKGVPHVIKGSIGRDGCVGVAPDAFQIDTSARVQLALHDDLLNQLLHALWYAGGLQLNVPLEALTGESSFSGFSLKGATLETNFLLPPILEACNQPDPMALRLQVGDLFATMHLLLGSDPLDLGTVVLADAGLTLGMAKNAKGETVLQATIAKELGLTVHLQDITKGWEDQKASFQKLIASMLTKALGEGSLPLGQPIEVPLPATTIDLATLVPGLPGSSKITVALEKLERAGGYTAVRAALQ